MVAATGPMNEDSLEPMGQLSAHLDRGWDLVSRGDYAGAMLSAEKSLELDDASAEAHNLVGFIHQAEGRPDDALDEYRAALEIDESYVDAMLNAAEVLFQPLERLDDALEMVREAIDWLEEDELDERTDAQLLEIDIHLFRGEREAATRLVKRLPPGPFENPALALAVGRARLDVGDVDGAEPLIRDAVERAPHPDAFCCLGRILETQADHRGAIMMFLRAREMDLVSPPPPWALAMDQFERRVQSALASLPPELSAMLEGALVVVLDVPGAEVVADGVDPRTPVLMDALSEPATPPRVGRLFVYKRNIERVAANLFEIEREIARSLETELHVVFEPPDADPPA